MDEACLRSGVVPIIIVFVNGYRSRHDLGRDVVGVNLSGVCHLSSGRKPSTPVAEATALNAKVIYSK